MGDLSGVVIAEKYELIRQMGRGGMGAVYEARNVSTRKRCAVKVLLAPELSADDEVVKRFFREARASGLIESEHVVAAYDSGIDAAGRVYYVMDCLQGEDLQQALRRLGPLSAPAAVKVVLQAATGLAHAHALDIVHRDIKPANLFLSVGDSGEIKVKILDFGVAKVRLEIFEESAHDLTRTGSMLGTPTYMSPEQVKRASEIDPSADVWSLGVVLFECLTGKTPWGEVGSVGELLAAILTLQLPLVQDFAPWVSPELAEIVQRALSRDPTQRMRSAAEMRDALRCLLPENDELYRGELGSVTDEERAVPAERLSVTDTVMIGATPRGGVPIVALAAPRRPWRTFALVAAIGALASLSAWSLTRRLPREETREQAVAHSEQTKESVLAAPSASTVVVAPTLRRAALEVGPAGVTVSVNGVPKEVANGRVWLEGAVDSQIDVRLTLGSDSVEAPVVITESGLVPKHVALGAGDAKSGRAAAPRRNLPKTAQPAATNSPANQASASGLTTEF